MAGSPNEPAHGFAPDETFPGSETEELYGPAAVEPLILKAIPPPPLLDDELVVVVTVVLLSIVIF